MQLKKHYKYNIYVFNRQIFSFNQIRVHSVQQKETIIECFDIAENERIRTQARPVSEKLCVK